MKPSTDPSREETVCRSSLTQSDLACILVHGLSERKAGKGTLPEVLGLVPGQLEDMVQSYFPGLNLPDLDLPVADRTSDQDAIAMLLLWRGGVKSPEAHWLASIIARRAMENRHLWEDMGLPNRQALGNLIAMHFPRLHAANTQNMRWKKFFYRQICSDQDFALCLSPSCDECEEKADCFAPEEIQPVPGLEGSEVYAQRP